MPSARVAPRPARRSLLVLALPALAPLLLAPGAAGLAAAPGPTGRAAPAPVPTPAVNDPALELTLVAREPDVVTPVGIAVDPKGRLYVVESHTHFRPADYKGPPADRVKRFEDRDGDGRFETSTVFAEGFRFAMNLAFSGDGQLHLVERSRVVRLPDADGDGRADGVVDVLRLETKTVYPHNGLGGIVFGPDGHLYVGLGENFGGAYTLRGSDGKGPSGDGEGGNVFRCRADGSGVTRFATGFWNPFGLAFYAGTHLLAVDDDPEVRPPDRLLDVVEGADFGFRYRYGTGASHPFVAWKGELPGTLPMAGAVGEGVTGILAGAAAALPARYADAVLVSSWSDRRIEAHSLRPHGASLRAEMTILVQGGDAFRPVALATGPDGTIYFTDWVRRRYEVHGHGRIWRLAPKDPADRHPQAPDAAPARRALERILATPAAEAALALPRALVDRDPFARAAAVTALARPEARAPALRLLRDRDPRVRLGALLALRRAGGAEARAALPAMLGDRDEEIRIVALIWAAEEKALGDAGAIHAAVAGGPVSPRLREIYRTAAEMLGVPARPGFGAPTPASLLARLARPASGGATLAAQREALWRLAGKEEVEPGLLERLEAVARDRRHPAALRADALAALSHHGRAQGLAPLLDDPAPTVRIEAARALRAAAGDEAVRRALATKLAAVLRSKKEPALLEELRFSLGDESIPAAPRPRTRAEWRAAVDRGGDPDAGRRVFVHPGTGCARCHRVGDVGRSLGPPLTYIGNERPDRLLESLLAPSADVVWPARLVRTRDGTEHVGMLWDRHQDGSVTLGSAAGEPIEIAAKEIVKETEADASLMPDGLEEAMTVAAFRDLFAFLRAQSR